MFVKHRMLGSKPRLSYFVGLLWGLIIFTSKSFQVGTDAAGLENTLRTTCLRKRGNFYHIHV